MFLKFPIRLNGDGLYEQKAQMLLAGSGEAHIINDLQYSCMAMHAYMPIICLQQSKLPDPV